MNGVFLQSLMGMVLILLTCCSGNDILLCQENCKTEMDSLHINLSNYRVQFDAFTNEAFLDSSDYRYKVCNSDILGNVEDRKKVNVRAFISKKCSDSNHVTIRVEELQVLQYCPVQFEETLNEAELIGDWYLVHISKGDSTTSPPCESPIQQFRFSENNEDDNIIYPYKMEAFFGYNYLSVKLSINDDIITFDSAIGTSLAVGTLNEQFFEQRLMTFLFENEQSVALRINHNTLTLINKLTDEKILFYSPN